MRSTLRSNLETEEFCEIFRGNFDKRLVDEERRNVNVLLMTEILFIVSCVKYTRLSERIRSKNSSIKFDNNVKATLNLKKTGEKGS